MKSEINSANFQLSAATPVKLSEWPMRVKQLEVARTQIDPMLKK